MIPGICSACAQRCTASEIIPYQGQSLCPDCYERRVTRELRQEARELKGYPAAPRQISKAVRNAYLGQNRSERYWLYAIGAILILIQPFVHLVSYTLEIEPLTRFARTSAFIGGLPDLKTLRELKGASKDLDALTYQATVVYFTGVDNFRNRPVEVASPGGDPGAVKKLAQSRCFTFEEALAARERVGKDGFWDVYFRPESPYLYVGSWEYDGGGRDGKISSIRLRNVRYTLTSVLLSLLGWVSAFFHAHRMQRKIHIFREGSFIVADSAQRVDVFRRELFDRAIGFTKLGKAWMILKLHLNVLYFIRTPKHRDTLILQLPPRVEPWTVNGGVVVCYLPFKPECAILVPAEVGTRLKVMRG